MNRIETIKSKIRESMPTLKDQYSVKAIGIFGSYVRGEPQKKSDLDILVEFEKPIGLLKFLELEEFLEEILHIKVDLVSKKALKPKIGERILKEAVFI